MVKKILGTMFTRVVAAVLAFAGWVLIANYLGPEKTGTISLIIFSVAIIQLIVNYIGGAALIYQTPRVGLFRLVVPVYIWTPLSTILTAFLLTLAGHAIPILEIIPDGHFTDVLLLALAMSFASANSMFLLGLEKVKEYNICNLVQVAGFFIILLIMLTVFGIRDIRSYTWALFLSNILGWGLSGFYLWPQIHRVPLKGSGELIREVLKFGNFVQLANLFQTFNYRLSLKFTDYFLGRSPVGILTIGLQLAEGFWLISRSISTVQFSRMSNEMRFDYSVRLTLLFARMTWMITAIGIAVLLCIPERIFALVFSASFGEVRLVIASLAPGIVFLSISIILSSFFSAVNKPLHNMIGSVLGLIFTVVSGIVLIPKLGIPGAGIAASISYFFITMYQFLVFRYLTGRSFRDLIPAISDFRYLMGMVKSGGNGNQELF